MIGVLLLAKRFFRHTLSSRMQYDLWFLLLGLLGVPFIPFRPAGFAQILSWFRSFEGRLSQNTGMLSGEAAGQSLAEAADWMNDLTLSVSSEAPMAIGLILFGIWLAGMMAMIFLVIRSTLHLRSIEQSALPLQNRNVRRIYERCLDEMKISRKIPIFSTAFLRSPIIVGIFRPRIYLPIHLIADYRESDLRYMLLHELQHYKYKDAIVNLFMNLAGIIFLIIVLMKTLTPALKRGGVSCHKG